MGPYIYIYISILLQTNEICLLNSKYLLKVSFIFDAKKSEVSREENRKNRIDNAKSLIKKLINKKDGLLYDKLESIKLSSHKPYDSLSFL